MDLISRAIFFATHQHRKQLRKYTFDPYIIHPFSVAGLVASVTNNPYMIAAAFLHDVVEDTEATLEDIVDQFGHHVAILVKDLTDVSTEYDGNRAERKRIDREHKARALPQSKTIALADLIDNTRDIAKHDPGFAKVYMAEKKLLLEVLTEGDPVLYATASAMVKSYYGD